jgi:glycosyltransferase involved in cell wall biosynthesis
MRFAVDAHAIGRHLTGNEVYIRSLLKAFAATKRDCEFVAYVSSDEARAFVPASIRTRRVAANPFIRLGFDLGTRTREDRPDLLHVQYTAPLACSVPVVVSVHDVSFLEYPEFFTRDRVFQLSWSVRRTVRRAAQVLTGSEFSRRAIVKAYGVDDEKVTVVPNAAGPEYRPISRAAAAAETGKRFSLPTPFILSVGDLQPRKNQVGLIEAFARLVRAYPQLKHRLAIAGKAAWLADRVYRAARESGVAERIQFLGFVTDVDLLHLYNACDLFVFPSFYEGFGLPVLEAMACGRAVACSSAAALPEVADSAAILFDPKSADEMARAMADLLLDAELRGRMERLGQSRAAQFNWQSTAQRTLEVFHRVAERSRLAGARLPAPSIAHR